MILRQAVLDGFLDWTEQFEGYTDFFYLDVLRLVTIGYGNLADPLSLVQGLPFTINGQPATFAQVSFDWAKVKNDRTKDPKDGGGQYEGLTQVRACREAIQTLCASKLQQNAAHLQTYYPKLADFPAKPQLALSSMAWAMGPDFPKHWPHFSLRINAQQWQAVAVQRDNPDSCLMNEAKQNDSFKRRNQANFQLFLTTDPSDPDSL